MEFDPFALDNRGYSPTNFYTGTGGRADGESKNIRLPNSTINQMAELIASRRIPAYRTEADFVRDALLHRLKYIAEMLKDDELMRFVDRQMMLSTLAARQNELAEWNSIVANYEENMQSCVTTGDTGLLQVMLSDAEHDVTQLRPVYQKRLRDLISKYREEMLKMDQDKMI